MEGAVSKLRLVVHSLLLNLTKQSPCPYSSKSEFPLSLNFEHVSESVILGGQTIEYPDEARGSGQPILYRYRRVVDDVPENSVYSEVPKRQPRKPRAIAAARRSP